MKIKLVKAETDDMKEIWHMQREGFSELLEKYKDHELSPAAECYERILEKSEMQGSFYYFIKEDNVNVGVIRIIDNHDGSRKRISPLWIMPGYRGRGYAQAAIREAENIHGAHCWSLDTILQEKGNLYLYEKLGYHQTGRIERINDRMDIVYYEKD